MANIAVYKIIFYITAVSSTLLELDQLMVDRDEIKAEARRGCPSCSVIYLQWNLFQQKPLHWNLLRPSKLQMVMLCDDLACVILEIPLWLALSRHFSSDKN